MSDARPAQPAPRRSGDGDRGVSRAERSRRTAELLDRVRSETDEPRRSALLEEVILLNRGVAEAVASRYHGRGVSPEDLVQVAYEGLTKAVQRFDPETRNDLLTFAVPTIRGELLRHFRDRSWSVRPPRRVQELRWKVSQQVADLEQELGHPPSAAEVKEALAISDEEYTEAVHAAGSFQATSLDQPATADSLTTLGSLIPAEDVDTGASEARVILSPVVRRLPERDRRLLQLRFFEDMTQAEIGRDLGVTQMQVSRHLHRILDNLREELGDDDLDSDR